MPRPDAVAYGRLGATANGGADWTATDYEHEPTWFYDVDLTPSAGNFACANYGVIDRLPNQECVNFQWKNDGFPTNFQCLVGDLGSNDYAYAAGEGYSDVRLRYLPGICDVSKTVTWYATPSPGHYEIEIILEVASYENIAYFYCSQFLHNHLYRINALDPRSPAGLIVWSFTLNGGLEGDYETNYWYEISMSSNEGLMQEIAAIEVTAGEVSNLERQYSAPQTPGNPTVWDKSLDNGHCIEGTFSGPMAYYYIGRSTSETGTYVYIGQGTPGAIFVDDKVQDGVPYYYRILRIDTNAGRYCASDFSAFASATAVNNNDPEQPGNGTGSYNMTTETVNLSWTPPNLGTNPDVAGYWVCPILPDPQRSLIIHASPIDRTTFRAPLPYAQYAGQTLQYFVAAMDYSGNIGPWSLPIYVYVGNSIGSSTSAEATAFNNGCKFLRIADTDELWITYQSNSHIYAARSTDEGATWTIKRIGQGFYPAISCNSIAETPRPAIVWQFVDAGIHYIYFSRYLGNDTWTDAQVIQTSANTTFGPPSFAIGICDTGHVVYTATSGGTSTVKYSKFYLFNPVPSATQDVGTGTSPSIAYMNSIGKPPIHVAWEYSTAIKYRTRTSAGWGLPETPSGSQRAKQPMLETVGNNAYVAWAQDESSYDIYWRYKVYTGLFGTWMPVKQVNNTPSTASTYPVLTGGYTCAWVEQVANAFDVYYSHYDDQLGAWLTPVNISNDPAQELFSNYPHITHKQMVGSTRIYFVWTEGVASPHPIKYRTYDQSGGKEISAITLPYYIAYGGEEEPSPFNRKRDGYVQYGNEPSKRIDKANAGSFLEYQFETLDPDRIYDLTAYLYQRGSTNLTLSAKIDNILLGTITLPPDSLVTLNHVIPTVLYKDNTINVKIFGNNNQAVSAILTLHEFEPEGIKGDNHTKANGPQGIESIPLTNHELSLSVQPTHTVRSLTIKYTLPQTELVRIALFDVSGRLVYNFVDDVLKPGTYTHTCDIGNLGLSRGVYFVRLETGDKTLVQKAVVVK